MVQLSHFEPLTTFILPALIFLGGATFIISLTSPLRSQVSNLILGLGGLAFLVASVFGTTSLNTAAHTANMDAIKEHYNISDVRTLKSGETLDRIRAENHADYLVSFDPAGEESWAEGVIVVTDEGKARLLVDRGSLFEDYNRQSERTSK